MHFYHVRSKPVQTLLVQVVLFYFQWISSFRYYLVLRYCYLYLRFHEAIILPSL